MHRCTIDSVTKTFIINKFINDGIFITLRRKLKQLCIPSRKHPKSFMVFRSDAAICKEQYRNLSHHYNIIHPYSEFCLYKQLLLFHVVNIIFIISALNTTLSSTNHLKVSIYQMCFELFLIVDIFLKFFTGYYDFNERRIILCQQSIAKHYLYLRFLSDILCVLPTLLLPIYFVKPSCYYYTKYFNYFKVLLYNQWTNYLILTKRFYRFSVFVHQFLKVLLTGLFLLLWMAAFFSSVMELIQVFDNQITIQKSDLLADKFLEALLVITHIRTGVQAYAHDPYQCLLRIVLLCMGYLLKMYLLVQMFQLWIIFSKHLGTNKKDHIVNQINTYLKNKFLPHRMKRRAMQYLDFVYQKNCLDQNGILVTMKTVQDDMVKAATKNLINRKKIFTFLPVRAQKKIISASNLNIYLPGDAILDFGESENFLYVVAFGTVTVFNIFGEKLRLLQDGDYFGECSFFCDGIKVVRVVAQSPCEIYQLGETDFLQIIYAYPDAMRQFCRIARMRLKSALESV